MSFSVTLSPLSLSSLSPQTQQKEQAFHFLNPNPNPNPNPTKLTLKLVSFETSYRLQASRRVSNFPQGNDNLVGDPRNWGRSISAELDEDDDEDDDEEEGDRSLDLLIRFVQNVFKKISKRARRAVRSVLPIAIPTSLVGFSVNGVLILAFLWILKAFLEVVCTLGSVVFVSILLIRGIWTGVTYLQESQNGRLNDLDDENHAWNGAQPVT